jgi:hypothetical protein
VPSRDLVKALSFSQPWLWAVLYAGKHVENRSWAPPIHMIDQRIALHAAASWDGDRKYMLRGVSFTPTGYLLALGLDPPSRLALYDASVICGTAVIDRIVTEDRTLPEDQKRWFFGAFGWILRDVRPAIVPVLATGKLGLWEITSAAEAELARQGLA